eukprot:maker-scaffold_8-snap-gene-8.66-mRNA-1 protein AED:0.02 eAED:0.02 QI:143/1/1/1/1/1/3/298/414
MVKKDPRSRTVSESRHDRAGLKGTRGLAKKGGGGGNYTWGKPGDELSAAKPAMDKNDPNYSSSEEVDKEFHRLTRRSSQANSSTSTQLTPGSQSCKKRLKNLVLQYFLTNDLGEFVTGLSQEKDLAEVPVVAEVVKQLILLSIEKSKRERGLVSKAVIEIVETESEFEELQNAFILLLNRASDYELDDLEFPRLLAKFLARSVVDEMLPPAFFTRAEMEVIDEEGKLILKDSKVLLTMKHKIDWLENIWGVDPSSEDCLSEMKKNIRITIKEYFESKDVNEACSLIAQLGAKHFRHEVVKRSVILGIERGVREQAMVSLLLKELSTRAIVSNFQFIIGFKRLFSELNDLELDNPGAGKVVEIFAKQAVKDGCLDDIDLDKARENGLREGEEKLREIEEEFGLEEGKGRHRAHSD